MFNNALFRDIKIGIRVLIKEKGFCALAVIVLALGIAGVTTMFSVVNGVMLRGFSFPNGSRLVSLNFVDPTSATFFGVNGQVSSMDFEELLSQQKSYDALAAYLNGSTVNATVEGHPVRYTGAYVTENFLRILGISPLMGRDFTAADNTSGAAKVAIIGYGTWQRDFGGAADILGKGVRINGKAATVIGVMPKGFAFPTNEEIYLPLFSEFPPKPRNDPAAINPAVLCLIKDGVSLDQANAEATTIARRLAAAYPDTNKQFNTGRVQPLLDAFTPRPLRGTLWTMLGFCVGVLLISCVNVMNMQFARATLRAKELAVRSSLGASRRRLVGQMLTESLLVAVIGAVVGIGLAYGSIDWLSATVRNLENPPPTWITFDVDAPVLLNHRSLDRRCSSAVGPLARLDVVANERRRGPARRRTRQHEPGGKPGVARPGRLSDRRDVRTPGGIAAAAAVDHGATDDRLRLRHRGSHLRACGPDGGGLPHARFAQGFLRSPDAAARA